MYMECRICRRVFQRIAYGAACCGFVASMLVNQPTRPHPTPPSPLQDQPLRITVASTGPSTLAALPVAYGGKDWSP